jgi:hypothetical protein
LKRAKKILKGGGKMVDDNEAIEVCMVLCDAVQVSAGKLFILGGGWDNCSPGAATMGVAVIVKIPWAMSNRKFHWELKLMDADGNQVSMGPDNRLGFEGGLEVGRPPGVPKGIDLSVPLAVNIGGVPLAPSSSFRWEFFVDGTRLGSAPFFTRDA